MQVVVHIDQVVQVVQAVVHTDQVVQVVVQIDLAA